MKPRAAAALVFAASVILCGVGAHLAADLAALGWGGDLDHLVASAPALGALAVAASALLAVAALAAPGTTRVHRVAAIVRALPDEGCGLRFFALAFAADVAVFALTEAAEGNPIGGGDLLLALAAALAACIVGALLFVRYHRDVVAALGALLVVTLRPAARPSSAEAWKQVDAQARVRRSRPIVFAASRRPPPDAASFRP